MSAARDAKVSHDQYFLSQVATQFWSVADGKLTVTWHHLAIAPSEHRVVHWLSSVVHAVCGMPMDAMYVCISPAEKPQVYRDLSDAKAATYGASAALGESW